MYEWEKREREGILLCPVVDCTQWAGVCPALNLAAWHTAKKDKQTRSIYIFTELPISIVLSFVLCTK